MPTMREQELENELSIANGMAARLLAQLTGVQMHEQEIAAKFRKKIAALEQELQLAQRGLTSGCGCPIGQCVRKKGDGASCWLQWAEGHLLQRIGHRRIDELVRHGHHPSRFREAQSRALESPPTDPDST